MQQNELQNAHQKNRHRFAYVIILLQIIIIVLFAVFVRITPHSNSQLNQTQYPLYQDINVMMLVGFGFLMAFMKQYSWSAISYTFFINSIMIQLYILLSYFWQHVFDSTWQSKHVYISEQTFIAALNSTAAQLVAFGVVLGRTGPFQILIMGIFCSIGYTLDEQLIHAVLKTFDAGGSMRVHTFGAAFGLAISFVLARIRKPTHKIQSTYTSITFALLGTLFLWVFFPSFNAGFYVDSDFHRSLIITNTILSLTGSCLATFAISALFRDKFNMKDIMHSTIAGGVIIAAPCGVATNSGICLAIGFFGGILSSLCLMKLSPKIQTGLGVYDTCGVAGVHGVCGIVGGWISAMVVASYQTSPGMPEEYQTLVNVRYADRTYSQQAGIQVAATFVAIGIGLAFGIAAALFISIFYHFQSHQFYRDSQYFQLPAQQIQTQVSLKKKTKHRTHKIVNRQDHSHIQLNNNTSKINN